MDIDEFLDKESEQVEKEPAKEIFLEKELKGYKEILEKINSCIGRNELTGAEKLYSELWLKMTEEKYSWQQDLYDSLIEINKRLSDSLSNLYQKTTAKIKTILTLIAKARISLRQGNNGAALTDYSQIINLYNKIPDAFLGEKRKIYIREIVPFHKELRENIEKNFFRSLSSELFQINNLINSTKTELLRGNVKEAAKFYTYCLNSYNALPNGFFLQKIELSNKILELYKELTIILEISNLKSKLIHAPEKETPVKPFIKGIYSRPMQSKMPILPSEQFTTPKKFEQPTLHQRRTAEKPTPFPTSAPISEKLKPINEKTSMVETLKEKLVKRKIQTK